MNDFNLEIFTRNVVRKVEEISNNVLVENPNTKSTFPVIVVSNPMNNELINDETDSLYVRYMITIECWNDKYYDAMSMDNNVLRKVRELNLLPTSSTNRKDEITNKYIFGHSYQVNYNRFTKSLERIR